MKSAVDSELIRGSQSARTKTLSGQLFKVLPMTVAARAMPDPSEEAQLLDTIELWVARELKPIVREYDHADRYPVEIVEQMKELGLFGATVGTEYGGLGLPAVTYAKIVM